MRAILEVKTGALTGRRIWLNAPQVQTVGRTENADFVVDSDAQMSGVHFAVHCNVDGCQLRDLDSSNGTRLNGERVSDAPLRDGDMIEAGETCFAVEVHLAAGAGPMAVETISPSSPAASSTPGPTSTQ